MVNSYGALLTERQKPYTNVAHLLFVVIVQIKYYIYG